MEARKVDGGKASSRLVEHDGEVGAGQADRFDTLAALKVSCEEAELSGVSRVGLLCVEDALIGLADERGPPPIMLRMPGCPQPRFINS